MVEYTEFTLQEPKDCFDRKLCRDSSSAHIGRAVHELFESQGCPGFKLVYANDHTQTNAYTEWAQLRVYESIYSLNQSKKFVHILDGLFFRNVYFLEVPHTIAELRTQPYGVFEGISAVPDLVIAKVQMPKVLWHVINEKISPTYMFEFEKHYKSVEDLLGMYEFESMVGADSVVRCRLTAYELEHFCMTLESVSDYMFGVIKEIPDLARQSAELAQMQNFEVYKNCNWIRGELDRISNYFFEDGSVALNKTQNGFEIDYCNTYIIEFEFDEEGCIVFFNKKGDHGYVQTPALIVQANERVVLEAGAWVGIVQALQDVVLYLKHKGF